MEPPWPPERFDSSAVSPRPTSQVWEEKKGQKAHLELNSRQVGASGWCPASPSAVRHGGSGGSLITLGSQHRGTRQVTESACKPELRTRPDNVCRLGRQTALSMRRAWMDMTPGNSPRDWP